MVRQFQLNREGYDLCTLQLVVNEWVTNGILEWLIHQIKGSVGAHVKVVVDFAEEIILPSSGKMEFTISKVEEN